MKLVKTFNLTEAFYGSKSVPVREQMRVGISRNVESSVVVMFDHSYFKSNRVRTNSQAHLDHIQQRSPPQGVKVVRVARR